MIALTLLLITGSHEASASVVCAGPPFIALSPSGLVQVTIGYGVWYLCSTTTTWGDFTPEGCRSLYAMLLSAQAQGKRMAFYFGSSSDCGTFGNWATPVPQPYYFHMSD